MQLLLYLVCTHGIGLILALLIILLFERLDVTNRNWFVAYKWYFILVLPLIWFSNSSLRKSVNGLLEVLK